jgi:hypothetical protein
MFPHNILTKHTGPVLPTRQSEKDQHLGFFRHPLTILWTAFHCIHHLHSEVADRFRCLHNHDCSVSRPTDLVRRRDILQSQDPGGRAAYQDPRLCWTRVSPCGHRAMAITKAAQHFLSGCHATSQSAAQADCIHLDYLLPAYFCMGVSLKSALHL